MKPRNDGGDPSNSFLFPGVDPSPEKECNWLRKDLIAAREAIGELHDKNATLRASNARMREALAEARSVLRCAPQEYFNTYRVGSVIDQVDASLKGA